MIKRNLFTNKLQRKKSYGADYDSKRNKNYSRSFSISQKKDFLLLLTRKKLFFSFFDKTERKIRTTVWKSIEHNGCKKKYIYLNEIKKYRHFVLLLI